MSINQTSTRIDWKLVSNFNEAIKWSAPQEIWAWLFAPKQDYFNKPKGTSDQGRCGDNDDDD